MYIKNCRNGSNTKHYSPSELYAKLENMRYEIGNFSYTQRYGQTNNFKAIITIKQYHI